MLIMTAEPMPAERLAEIKARRAALTEHTTRGDWRYDDCDTVLVFPADGGAAEAVASITVWGKEGSAEETALGEFIGHAPTDTDALLAEVERLNGMVQFLGSHLQGGAAAFIEAAADVVRMRLKVGEYENTLNSFTTCTECAGHLDREHTAEWRAAQAEAERDRLRAELAATRANAAKWAAVEPTIRRAADHGNDPYVELMELAEPTEQVQP